MTLSAPETHADAPPVEYVDREYGYAFQYPSDWKIRQPPPRGEAGEARVLVQGPGGRVLLATVGQLERSVSKQAFESNPRSKELVDRMIDFTIDQVYSKTSKDIHASGMTVSERRFLPADAGIKFYISTAHTTSQGTVVVAGVHVIPFGKPYMVSFLMITPVNPKALRENEAMTKAFNSFHLIGEKPLPREAR